MREGCGNNPSAETPRPAEVPVGHVLSVPPIRHPSCPPHPAHRHNAVGCHNRSADFYYCRLRTIQGIGNGMGSGSGVIGLGGLSGGDKLGRHGPPLNGACTMNSSEKSHPTTKCKARDALLASRVITSYGSVHYKQHVLCLCTLYGGDSSRSNSENHTNKGFHTSKTRGIHSRLIF